MIDSKPYSKDHGETMNNLEGKIESVGKIFSSDFFFAIPDYQRPFAWDESNFQDLIDDLELARSGHQYFLGTLVLHKKEEKNLYDVVDGQQRITSLLILFACLRDLIDDPNFKKHLQGKIVQEENQVDGIPELPRISVKDRQTFREIVLAEGGTEKIYKADELAEPQTRYVKAITIFKSALNKYTQDELQNFTRFINQHCNIIYLATSTFDDAFRLFTIVNDRGRQLRRIDILKAQNISPDAIANSGIRERVARQWEDLENDIGEKEFESVLFAMRMILIKEKPQEDLFAEFENKIFKRGLLSKGEKFVDELKVYCDLYRRIFADKDYLTKTDPNALKFRAMIHIMDSEFEASEWRACLMFFAKKFAGDLFYEFMLVIEKVYLEQWVSGIRKDERFSIYSRILKLIDSKSKPSEILDEIKYNPATIVEAAKLKDMYRSRFAKYFLLRLEITASEHDVYKEINAKSIEHVFPRNPSDTSDWIKDEDYSEHIDVVDCIGNLVLLSKSKNSSASNHDFEVKKERYLKDRMSDYPRSLKITHESNWTIAKIKSNRDQLAEQIIVNP